MQFFFSLTKRMVMTILFVLIYSLSAIACDLCGAFMGITPYDNQSGIQFLHRYRSFNGYSFANQSHEFFPSGAWRLAHDPAQPNGSPDPDRVYNHSDFEVYRIYELRAKYFLHPRLEINVFLPFVHNMDRTDDEKNTISGVGDPTVFAAWHLIRRIEDVSIRQRLIIGLGSKLQFGKTALYNTNGERYSVMLQPGTGSSDLFTYMSYMMGWKKWGANINGVYKVNGINKFNERIGNSIAGSLNLFARLKSSQNWVWLPSLQSYYEYTKGIYLNDRLLQGTGINVLMAGLGLDVYWKNWGLLISAQIPIAEKVSGTNLSTAGRIVVGFSYSLNQTRYLFGGKE
jgi:hypothetical protein